MEVPRSSKWPMVPMEDAIDLVLCMTERLKPEPTALKDAVGRVLAEDVIAPSPQPSFAASIKDGYAVVAEDGPGTFKVLGEVTAGDSASFRVVTGSVAYVTTGAPVPAGADAVVQVEWTKSGQTAGTVEIERQVKVGNDIRAIGSDVAVGQLVLQKSDKLGAAEIGILASCGIGTVSVFRRPRVALVSTGDELVDIDSGEELRYGQIYDSNRPMLREMIVEAGGIVIDMKIAPDTERGVSELFDSALADADIVLTSGGISMGNRDFVKGEIEKRGKVHFGRVLMKPGKPLTFATIDGSENRKLLMALPGNPVSSYVCFHLAVAPAIRQLAGQANPRPAVVQAVLTDSIKLDAERPEFHRATVSWDSHQKCFVAKSTGKQASSRLLSTRSANALLRLPNKNETLQPGVVVDALIVGPI